MLVLPYFCDLVRVCQAFYTGSQKLTICSIPSGGITTFGPLIIKSLGFDKYTAILLNMPFGAIQIIATMGGAALATWTKKKGPAIALLCVPPIIGCVMLLVLPHTAASRGPQLAGYYFISFYPGICKSYFIAECHTLLSNILQLLSSIPGRHRTQLERPRRRPQQQCSSLANPQEM